MFGLGKTRTADLGKYCDREGESGHVFEYFHELLTPDTERENKDKGTNLYLSRSVIQ